MADRPRHSRAAGAASLGVRVVDRLARDFKEAFPDMCGSSSRNLKYMRALARAFPQPELVQKPVTQNSVGACRHAA
nr:DUF1016 N-terminal domain-containing protein [Paraburkholderia youngii]